MALALYGSRKVKWEKTGALYSIVASRKAIHITGLGLPRLSIVIRVDTRMSQRRWRTTVPTVLMCVVDKEYIALSCLDLEWRHLEDDFSCYREDEHCSGF